MKFLSRFLLALLLAASLDLIVHGDAYATSIQRWFLRAPGGQLDPVELAHADFLEGNFSRMSQDLHKALLAHPNDPVVQSNLLALLDSAYQVRGGKAIPADWSLPAEITSMKIAVRRKYNPNKDQAKFTLRVSGVEPRMGTVEDLQLVRFPSEVVLDRGAKVGEWSEDREKGGEYTFASTTETLTNAPDEGLYTLRIKVRGKPAVQGWVILNRIVASDAPSLEVPRFNQAFRTETPQFEWNDFKSPEYRDYEDRRVALLVSDQKVDTSDAAWSMPARSPFPSLEAAKGLGRGSYSLQLVFQERRKFGDLLISRESATRVPFSITE